MYIDIGNYITICIQGFTTGPVVMRPPLQHVRWSYGHQVWQVDFSRVLRFPPTRKVTHMDIDANEKLRNKVFLIYYIIQVVRFRACVCARMRVSFQ